MDTHALRAALENALRQMGNDARPESAGSSLPPHIQEGLINQKLSKEVLRVLERQEEFAGGQARMINSMHGFFGFQSHIVARLLVSEARRRQSADSAVQWLQKVLHTERGEGILVRALWGVNPTRGVRLPGGVDFLPFQSLPSSRQKEMLTTDASSPTWRFAVPSFAWSSPTAALITRVEVRPFLVDISKEQDPSTKHRPDDLSRLDDIRLCLALALAEPTVLIPGPSWFQYLDPDLETALDAAATSFSHQEIVALGGREAIDFDPSSASDLVQAFMALDPKLKRRVRTALQRLHQALIRRSPADRAVELSIALDPDFQFDV